MSWKTNQIKTPIDKRMRLKITILIARAMKMKIDSFIIASDNLEPRIVFHLRNINRVSLDEL